MKVRRVSLNEEVELDLKEIEMRQIAQNFTILINLVFSQVVFGSNLSSNVKMVPNAEVCMVNDRHFGVKQIEVPVGKKMYYGCCAMCKAKLTGDRTVRFGKDPISGKEVDKSSAVIAVKSDGSVLYFENQSSFEKFQQGENDG